MLGGADQRCLLGGSPAFTRTSTARSTTLQIWERKNKTRRRAFTSHPNARTGEDTKQSRWGVYESNEVAWKDYICDSFHPEKVSASLGYTWLTHWRLVEEDRLCRKSIVESVRRRKNERNKEMFEYIYGAKARETGIQSGNTCPQLEGENIESCIVHGRLGISMAGSSTLDMDLDELAWIASHPDPQEINSSADSTSSMVAADLDNFDKTKIHSGEISDNLSDSLARPISIQVGGNVAMVRPLWISVHTKTDEDTALLFESVVPLRPEVVEKLSSDLTPFCSIVGCKFQDMADLQYGSWSNYFIGVVGDVGTEEIDILWPNQILHRDRVLYNMRNGLDIARFLADPTRRDVDLHLANLQRLARERRYHPAWCWHMLRARWGEQQLRRLGIEPSSIFS